MTREQLDDVQLNCPKCGQRMLPLPADTPHMRRRCLTCGDWFIDTTDGRFHPENRRQSSTNTTH